VAAARAGDAVVVAGKGHETSQQVRGNHHPFCDAEVLAQLLEERSAR
jgi:UDP-N-acetylmuramoyl-L-alanyl-D-glutamate--2,6-diaminopimelate ligase